jgi:hypothetical protein
VVLKLKFKKPLMQPQKLPFKFPSGVSNKDLIFLGLGIENNKYIDYSGNENHGVIVGASNSSKGRSGHCLNFDGTDDYITTSYGISNLGSNISMVAWVKTSSTNGWDWVYGKLSGINNFFFGRISADTNLRLVITGVILDTTDVNISDGLWHHLVGQSTDTGQEIYVDGVLKASNLVTGSPDAESTFTIGRSVEVGEIWNGEIDQTMLFNRSLTAEEILLLSQMGAPGND